MPFWCSTKLGGTGPRRSRCPQASRSCPCPHAAPTSIRSSVSEDLQSRGWTRSLIKRFLGEDDYRESVNHWANFSGKSMFYRERVLAAERCEEFRSALLALCR